jgi:hypothetical protein
MPSDFVDKMNMGGFIFYENSVNKLQKILTESEDFNRLFKTAVDLKDKKIQFYTFEEKETMDEMLD